MGVLTRKHRESTSNTMYRNRKSLYEIVGKLQTGLLPLSIKKKTIIVNDADKNLKVFGDENILAYIIGSLMSTAVTSTSNCCIRVETSMMEKKILVRVSNNGMFVHDSLVESLDGIMQAAKTLNGHISLQTEQPGAMTALLYLPSRKTA
jgi:hypothetical protein